MIQHWISVALLGAFLIASAATGSLGTARGVPPVVFVSRGPLPADLAPGVPGLGPRHRAAAVGGRLLVARGGRVTPLLPEGSFYDVSDPSVSWDGKLIAFAGMVSPGSPWRIYVVGADGKGLVPITRDDRDLDLGPLGASPAGFERYDDLDPCWLTDGSLCFASTRFPQVSGLGSLPVTNLFTVGPEGSRLTRITTERNGAEEPTVDLETGRIVYTRWWFSPYLASESEPHGITTATARAVPAEPVNLWQPITVMPDGDGGRLAGGNPRVRAETMAYQPIVLEDGTLIGVRGENLSLFPAAGSLSLELFPKRFAPARRLVGREGQGSACAPAPLPDGRILFSYDREGRGDFGLYTIRPDGRGLEPVFDLPGTLELDAVPLVARRRPPLLVPSFPDLPHRLPVTHERQLRDSVNTFRFDCLNVFANAPVDFPVPDAPPIDYGVRIRFYGVLARPGAAHGDTVVLVREVPIERSGAIHEHELPADAPMFEQLVDAHGRVLRSPGGPAHVPGFNAGRFGGGTKCVGCHIGHSVIPVAVSAGAGKRFNVSPSAEVTATSFAEGTAGPRAVVDRRAKGPAGEVGWIADRAERQAVRLSWRYPIDVDGLVLYAIDPRQGSGTDLRIRECQLAYFLDGREVDRDTIRAELSPRGTRVACRGIRVDSIEVRPTHCTGRVNHRAAVALAEIETLARLPED
jgi:hypothetical protein